MLTFLSNFDRIVIGISCKSHKPAPPLSQPGGNILIALQLLGGELQRLAILPHRSRDDLLVLLQMLRRILQVEAVSLHFRQPLLLLGAGLE